MGHTRLGKIPTSKKWKVVVRLLAGGEGGGGGTLLAEDIETIAQQTLTAAEAGLLKAIDDPGLRYTFYLLTQLVLASREEDWQSRLEPFGIRLSEDATLLDLTIEIQSAIDDYLFTHARSTDFSEIAQQAAGEALTELSSSVQASLFGSSRDDLQRAVREVSTKNGFARLGQTFFARFMGRFLNFYLSRITAAQMGGARLHQLGDLSAFNEALKTHCEQSARIVRDFCGEWYSKTEFQQGINLENTSGFMAVALKKLQAELERQREAE